MRFGCLVGFCFGLLGLNLCCSRLGFVDFGICCYVWLAVMLVGELVCAGDFT